MIHALEPLVELPGVELAMLATVDGVPIASCGSHADAGERHKRENEASIGKDDALAAMALAWIGELELSTSPLGWGDSQRVLLRCARGSLLMQRCRGAVLVILLAPGVSSEDIRLPMAGVVARIERGSRVAFESKLQPDPNPPGALPTRVDKASVIEFSEPTKPHLESA